MNRYKVGTCLYWETDKEIHEGVIYNIFSSPSGDRCDILWFVKFKNRPDSCRFSTMNSFHVDSMDSLFQFAPVPHFCKVENLYDVICKQDTNLINFLGLSTYHSTGISMSYFKTQNHYFQIIALSTHTFMEKGMSTYVYVQEADSLDELYYNENSRYFHPQNNVLDVRAFDLKVENSLFCNASQVEALDFQKAKNKNFSGVFFMSTMGMTFSYVDFDDVKLKKKYPTGHVLNCSANDFNECKNLTLFKNDIRSLAFKCA